MLEYIKGFLVLFMVMTLCLYLVPGERLKRYIRFFTEIILTVGILSPLLSLVFDSDKFLEKIEYETFTEDLSEIGRDMERIEFLQNEYYLEEYEKAIAEDVRLSTQPIAENYGYAVTGVEVHLTEKYRLSDISVLVEQPGQEKIEIEEITWMENTAADYAMNGEGGMAAEMKRKLAEYYQLDEALITVQCEESG